MDEPSMGLAPILVEKNFEIIKQVHESGVAMLIVEQNANVSLSIADAATSSRPAASSSKGRPRACARTKSCGRPTLVVRGLMRIGVLAAAVSTQNPHQASRTISACRARFPIFERLVYINSCFAGRTLRRRARGYDDSSWMGRARRAWDYWSSGTRPHGAHSRGSSTAQQTTSR